jgi:hypothetical protein
MAGFGIEVGAGNARFEIGSNQWNKRRDGVRRWSEKGFARM